MPIQRPPPHAGALKSKELSMNTWLDFVGMPAQLGAAGDGSPATQGAPGSQSDPIGGTGGGGQSPTGGTWTFPIMIFGVMILMFFFMARSGRKQRKQRSQMLTALGKNDKVQTTGGVIGIIVELKDREMVLRVDEQSNTRVRFSRSAVAHVLRSTADGGEEKPPVEMAVDGRQHA